MSKLSKYEDTRRVMAEKATEKATQSRDGKAAFGFTYRNQLVWVHAKQDASGKVRIHTDSVKNKG